MSSSRYPRSKSSTCPTSLKTLRLLPHAAPSRRHGLDRCVSIQLTRASSGIKTAAESHRVSFIVKPGRTSVAVHHYGQRKQKSEKGNQETEEREAEGSARAFPPGYLSRGRMIAQRCIAGQPRRNGRSPVREGEKVVRNPRFLWLLRGWSPC